MNFDDPFTGYTWVLRTIVYVLVPAFTALQVVRLRRALHIFQLEGYKRDRFSSWVEANPARARFLTAAPQKKPLVMTGRAWRLLVTAAVLNVVAILVLPGVAHLAGGWPFDVVTWAAMTAVTFAFLPRLLLFADVLMTPIQNAINGRYLRAATRKLQEIRPLVIGVTGSFGKTSTKFAIAAALEHSLATPGSFNTPLGVCRTINESLDGGHRSFIVEMGAYREGDIAELSRFVEPSIGVLTSIGPAHLERFGSLDAIRRAKYELIQSLPSDGTAVMNADDLEVRTLADATDHVAVVRYGLDASGRPDVTAREVTIDRTGTSFTIEARGVTLGDVKTRLLGRYAIGHVLAATAVALAANVEPEHIRARLAELTPPDHRLKIIEGTGGVTVIDDAYNSNPDGAEAALEVLRDMPGGRKVVVSPGMVELGELQRDANENFGAAAAKVADTLIVVAGTNRDALVAGARRAGTGTDIVVVDSLAEAQVELGKRLAPGDIVLFENDLPDQY